MNSENNVTSQEDNTNSREWFIPAGTGGKDRADLYVTPQTAGWQYCGIQVYTLDAKQNPVTLFFDNEEAVLVPLSARNFVVTVDREVFHMNGRVGVFDVVSDWMYLPVGSQVSISGNSGEVAIVSARTSKVFPVYYGAADTVSVEVRGSGRSTRQVTNYATPDSFTQADKISVCEVLTPGGNWSSWPPHRHDGIGDCVTSNEEIYYFRIGKLDSAHGDPTGTGLFRCYTVDGTHDETVSVKDKDTYLVPEGYHGPTVANPEYPMYFLNVLAGPGEERSMAFCDDPDQHWIRASWETQEQDPRLPMTSAEGRVKKN
jgi:5-deoxy-glucuronate isomerase